MRFLLIVSMMTAVAVAGWMITRTEAATTRSSSHTVSIQIVNPTNMMSSLVDLPREQYPAF
jgi:hypothetical protein